MKEELLKLLLKMVIENKEEPEISSSVFTLDKEAYYIVRTYSAGVFAGNIKKLNKDQVLMKNARRLWYWDGAASLSQLAQEGVSKPENCKFPCPVNEVFLLNVIEILKTTPKAEKIIKEVPVWKE